MSINDILFIIEGSSDKLQRREAEPFLCFLLNQGYDLDQLAELAELDSIDIAVDAALLNLPSETLFVS